MVADTGKVAFKHVAMDVPLYFDVVSGTRMNAAHAFHKVAKLAIMTPGWYCHFCL